MSTRGAVVGLLTALSLVAASCGDDGSDGERIEKFEPTSGEATLEVSGEVDTELTLPLLKGRVDERRTLLEYGEGDEADLEVGGALEPGENPSEQVAVVISLEEATFASELHGECTIEVTESSGEQITGDFGCPQLSDGEIRIAASGTFSAAA